MMPTINARPYRPRQVILARENSKKNTRHLMLLSQKQCKQLGLIIMAALVIGLGLTRFFHDRIVELRTKVAQLQTSNTTIADEYRSLCTTSAHLASKTQVAALAQKKLHLFEPDHWQVRRMWSNNDKINSGL